MLKILKITNKEDYNYSSWKDLVKEYDLVFISSKLFEELSGIGVHVPISELNSLNLEEVKVRCSHCGCSYFTISGRKTIGCFFDDSGLLVEEKVIESKMGKPLCRGCRNIVGF